MENEIANTIPLPEILGKIGIKPTKTENDTLIYISPLSIQKHASLKVSTSDNSWVDDQLGLGGNAIAFVCQYLKLQNVECEEHDARRWLTIMFDEGCKITPISYKENDHSDVSFHVEGTWPLTYPPFFRYLNARGISAQLASDYLKQVTVSNNVGQGTVASIGFRNEENGYLLRSQSLKAYAGPKAITFIRGERNDLYGFHIFYSIFDYLSILTQRRGKGLDFDAIILNSWSCLRDAAGYIHGFGYQRAYLWLDNSLEGAAATASFAEFFSRQPGLRYVCMNKRYLNAKDVNAAHISTFGSKAS